MSKLDDALPIMSGSEKEIVKLKLKIVINEAFAEAMSKSDGTIGDITHQFIEQVRAL